MIEPSNKETLKAQNTFQILVTPAQTTIYGMGILTFPNTTISTSESLLSKKKP